MDNIKISIIVPVYNAEKYIERCINSILTQTFQKFELILVNDGSSDRSKIICEAYAQKDGRIVLLNKANGGSASAKNVGLDNAHGEYIEFVDADDYLDEEYIANLLKGYMDYDTDICIGNIAFTMVRNDSIKSRNTVDMQKGYFTLKEFLKFYPVYMPKAVIGSQCNKLYKREIIEKFNIRFNTAVKNNEDTHFNYDYLSKCRAVYVSYEPYYNYINENANSLSSGYIPNIFETYVLTYNKAIDFLRATDTYEMNSDFQRKYFVNLIIGAMNMIVTRDVSLSRKEKTEQIKRIVNNKELAEAADKMNYTDPKKKMMLILIKRKYYRLIYLLLFLNNKFKREDSVGEE